MANKNKKRERSHIPHDYVTTQWIHCIINGKYRVFRTGEIVWESEYEKLSDKEKTSCIPLPPKDILVKEKVKKEKERNKVKIETHGFDYKTSFRKSKEK